jgi:hypothetical protein
MEEHAFGGDRFKLACLLPPPQHRTGLPKLADAPGFRAWSRQDIMAALAAKPCGLRPRQFAGPRWIVNQMQVGSCCSAATTGALRRSATLTGAAAVPPLNWEFLYAQVNGGSDRGSLLVDNNRAVRTTGVPVLTDRHRMNVDIYKGSYAAADYTAAAEYRARDVYECDTEDELLTLVLSGQGAAVVAVSVGANFNSLDRDGFPPVDGGPGNHAVGICDADLVNGEPALWMYNSWGLNWGMGGDYAGHCLLSWNRHLARTVPYHKFFVILSDDIKSQNDAAPTVAA